MTYSDRNINNISLSLTLQILLAHTPNIYFLKIDKMIFSLIFYCWGGGIAKTNASNTSY